MLYNILTSCDEGLIPYLAVELVSVSKSLPNDKVDFYLMHSRVEDASLKMLGDLCDSLGNMRFVSVKVEDTEPFERWKVNGGNWPIEAFFPLLANIYLPEDLDRVLYLDAGDIILNSDISEYYNNDFKGKMLSVHAAAFKVVNNRLITYDEDDMDNFQALKRALRGVFNSGSYMINLEKMRRLNITCGYYDKRIEKIKPLFKEDPSNIYWTDQGLLSYSYIGDTTYFKYPEISNIWYMPYNFCVWYYDRANIKPDYTPAVIHFAGNFKPWTCVYPIKTERFVKENPENTIASLKLGQAEWYYLWHEYAMMTDRILTELGY